jgi:serine/threonine-protein kinase
MGERELDARSDVYALGCVTYEMLTGEPPFTGPTAQAIVARVVTEEPRSLTLQRKSIPPNVDAAVSMALSKLPADRFSTAAQFADALANPGLARTVSLPAARAAARVGPLRWTPWAAVLVAAALGVWGWLRPRAQPPAPPVTRFAIRYDGAGRVGDGPGSPIAVSPDGSRIVYVGFDAAGAGALFSRSLDREEPVQLAGSSGAVAPFFSPDGASLGFQQGGKLRKVSLSGGAVTTITDNGTTSASWGPGDAIYFTNAAGLHRVSAAGGNPNLVAAADSASRESYRWPDVLSDGSAVLITLIRAGSPSLAVISLPDGNLHEMGQPGMYPRWVNGGYLTFVQQDGTLFSAPYDAGEFRLAGPPVPVADGVRFGPAFPAKMGVARTGTLVYQGGRSTARELIIAERNGPVTAIPLPGRNYHGPRFSPDGQRIAFLIFNVQDGLTSDLWTYDLRGGSLSRLTFDSVSSNPDWMPDGRRLVYTARGQVYTIATDGSGVPESLLAFPDGGIGEVQVSRTRRTLVFREGSGARRNIWMASLDSARTQRPLLRTPFDEKSIALSPDGQWLAYVSDEAGTEDIYVRRLEEGSGRWRVSKSGGQEPRWGPGGRELFYRSADSILSVGMEPGTEPRFTDSRMVLVGEFNSDRNRPIWDVSPDGRRFVFTRSQGEPTGRSMNIVLHWFDQLRAR